MARKPRLTGDDKATWDKVARTLTPLSKIKRDVAKVDLTASAMRSMEAEVDQPEPKHPEPVRPRKPVAAKPTAQKSAQLDDRSSYELDGRTYDRLRKGKLKPDRRIDLHGMTAARAHAALKDFIMIAASDGCRMVLVITGKGLRGNEKSEGYWPLRRKPGVIRESLPQWLAMPPLRGIVLQHHKAQDRDGGSGAYYVYLRRAR